MEQDLEQFIQQARQVQLDTQERTTIRRFLVAFIQTHTPRRTIVAWFAWFLQRPAVVILPLLLLAILGGISYRARQTLPGDSLYSVKTNVNEFIEGVFATADEDEISWEITKAEQRMEELETLAAAAAY